MTRRTRMTYRGKTQRTRTFTASGSWVVPSDVTSVEKVECWGPGGNGGAASTTKNGGGGGGGAYAAGLDVPVTPGASVPFVVGTPPTGQGAGDDSSWNTSQVIAKAGTGGGDATEISHGGFGSPGTAAASTAYGGGTKNGGGNGASGQTNTGGGGGGGGGSTGAGGSAPISGAGGTAGTPDGGAGGSGGSEGAPGTAGAVPGGGGGGGGDFTSGGAGARGQVKITYRSAFAVV